jgi:hypothetical protein
MKYVILTKPNADGVSEVFHTMTIIESELSSDLTTRWNSIVESSPVNVVTAMLKENVIKGSLYDEATGNFSLAEGASLEHAQYSVDKCLHAFLLNNVVTATFSSAVIANVPNPKYVAAFADPVTVIALEDDSDIDLGYTYNGTTFSPPADI